MNSLKSITFFALVISLPFLWTSCGEAKPNEQASTSQQVAGSDQKSTISVTSEVPKVLAQKILASYLTVKDALVQTNGLDTSSSAKQLVKILEGSQDELVKKIRFDAEHIAETKNSEHQRDHFNTLSDHVFELVKTTQANESTLYRQYCPMAFDNKGAYWLSVDKEINNPYFGDKMLHCGKVTEEI